MAAPRWPSCSASTGDVLEYLVERDEFGIAGSQLPRRGVAPERDENVELARPQRVDDRKIIPATTTLVATATSYASAGSNSVTDRSKPRCVAGAHTGSRSSGRHPKRPARPSPHSAACPRPTAS